MIQVLIADDHKLFIDGIKSILEKEIGIKIIGEASNGLEVIKLIENGLEPDIILTDIRMPILDGITTTRILKKDHPSIKILAVSMYDQNTDVIEMMEAGAKGYVTKNVEKKELLTAIQNLIKGEYYFGENISEEIENWLNNKEHTTEKSLTKRELEILELIVKGRTSTQIAHQLKISKFTVDTHRKNIHKKLGIKSNTGLVNYVHNHKNFQK